MKRTLLAILAVSFIGCVNNKNSINLETISLSPYKKIEQINDTTFLSLIMNITENKGLVYFSDLKNNRIVCVDSNYKLVHIFGSPGRGPAEFNFPGGAFVHNNKLYAVDEGNNRINIFDLTGKYINNIKGIIPFKGRFIINDSMYFGSSLSRDSPPIFKAYLNGELVQRFGNVNRILNNINTKRLKNYFLESWKDQIIAIVDSDPVIERYTIDGKLVSTYDYSNIDYIASYINLTKLEDKKNRAAGELIGTHMFCLNSYIQGDKLFLLLAGRDKQNNKQEMNRILMLDVGKEKIVPIKILELKNNNGKQVGYYSFCVSGDKLIAYDCYSYEIHEFSIQF